MRRLRTIAMICLLMAPACGGVLKQEYEYEEELYLALDGSATVNVNASVAALVALHGADLPVDPRARVDRDRLRAFFGGAASGATVSRVSLSRRDGRRFVHVGIDVSDLRQLPRLAPFAWSTYRFDRRGDVFEYRQVVGKSAGRDIGSVGWTGEELVAFRMHIPSEIPFHNAPSKQVERGNILAWEQSLTDRLAGAPLEIEVQMEPESILYTTLLLFAATVVAAMVTFATVIWFVKRSGQKSEVRGQK